MTDTELLASWMTLNGYATGHGDNLAALVAELDWQHRERMAWRPIETAPKDASPVLLWSPDGAEALDIYIGYRIDGAVFPDGFAYFENTSMDAVDAQPTHWMPLPDPPNSPLPQRQGEAT